MTLPLEIPVRKLIQEAFVRGDADASSKAFEKSNVGVLENLYAAILSNNLPASKEFLAPDVVLEMYLPDEFPLVLKAKGVDDVCAAIEKNYAALTEQQPKLLSLVAQGDCIILLGQETGVFRESGMPYDAQYMQQYIFQDGKVKYCKQIVAYTDKPK